MSSFYNNLDTYITNYLKNNNPSKLINNKILNTIISDNDDYKKCYNQFVELIYLENHLLSKDRFTNSTLSKIKMDYYNHSLFVNTNIEQKKYYFAGLNLNDYEKKEYDKIFKIKSPFYFNNNLLINSDYTFPQNVLNLTNTDKFHEAVKILQKDNRNLTPIDLFYMYGIPCNKIPDNIKSRIKFNKNKAADILSQLYAYQITMIDCLRTSRTKNISNLTIKKEHPLSKHDDYQLYKISHPLKSKLGFMIPLPIEFMNGSKHYYHNIIMSYVDMFNLPRPGFMGEPSQGFENYDINMYLDFLKTKGYSSFFTHYLVNFISNLKCSCDFVFLKIIFLAELENGEEKYFTIGFPIRINNNQDINNIEQEIYNRIETELQIQLEFYDEEEGIFALFIIDLVVELVSNVHDGPILSAYGRKLKKYVIEPLFESMFPDLNLCLFECFFYLYKCQYYSFDPTITKIDDIMNMIGINNWIDYKIYLINFFYSLEVIPQLKESCIKGDVFSMISILVSNYMLYVGVYNTLTCKYYPENLFEDDEIKNVLIWCNFHVYLSTKTDLLKYIDKKKRRTYSKYKMIKMKRLPILPFKNIIMSLDIETLTDNNGLIYGNQKPYLIQTYGISDDLNQTFWGVDSCVDNFVDWFSNLFNVNNNIYIFAHNGSQFDYKFLMGRLMRRYRTEVNGDHTKIVTFKINNVTFVDFFMFFQTSLNNLSKSWLNKEKLDFDHSLITKDNYNDYKELAIKYCLKDCELLYEVVDKFLITIFNTKFDDVKSLTGILDFYTAPQLALKIYKTIYMDDDTKLVGSIGQNYFIEKSSYYGGMCVVYRKECLRQLYCYDVNSCYPASMLKIMPYKFIDELETNYIDNYVDYHLYLIDYSWSDDSIILNLPTRIEDEVIYLKNNENQWHWGNEIKTAIYLGCNIRVKKTRRYEGKDVFKKYIEDIYEMRLKSKRDGNTCLVDFFKLLMNSLYGKLGQKLNLSKHIGTVSELSELVSYYMDEKIKNIKLLDNYCVEYEYNDQYQHFNQIGSLVRFAAFITAEARCILLSPFSQNVLPHSSLYYTDTDSIFIDKELSPHFISQTELGKFKLEYTMDFGLFLAPKMYILRKDNECKMKMKGVPQKHLKESFFIELKENGIQLVQYPCFKRFFGEVHIGDIKKRIILKSYKRIYNDDGISIGHNNKEDFLNEKKRILDDVKEKYPTSLPIKTDIKIIQQKHRKELKDNSKILMNNIKTEYILSYDEFYNLFTKRNWDLDNLLGVYNRMLANTNDNPINKNKKKDDDKINKCNEQFMNYICPEFLWGRNRSKTPFYYEMLSIMIKFILSGDHTKEQYYYYINKFLIITSEKHKIIATLDKFKPTVNREEILREYYNYNPGIGILDYTRIKYILKKFCPDLEGNEIFKGKASHKSEFYHELMRFYFKYLIDIS
jgi:hypothetical protein